MATNKNIWQQANEITQKTENPRLLLSIFRRKNEDWATGTVFIRNQDIGGMIIKQYKDMNELNKDIESGALEKFVKGCKQITLKDTIDYLSGKIEKLNDVWDEYSEDIINGDDAVLKADQVGYSIFNVYNDLREATFALSEIICCIEYELEETVYIGGEMITIDIVINYLEELKKELFLIRDKYLLYEMDQEMAIEAAEEIGFTIADPDEDLRQATFILSQTIDNIWAEL